MARVERSSQSVRRDDLNDGRASCEQTNGRLKLLGREPRIVGSRKKSEGGLLVGGGEELLVVEEGERVDKVGEDPLSQGVLGERLRGGSAFGGKRLAREGRTVARKIGSLRRLSKLSIPGLRR